MRMTREELDEGIGKLRAKEVAKDLGICDVAVAKICRKLNVPNVGQISASADCFNGKTWGVGAHAAIAVKRALAVNTVQRCAAVALVDSDRAVMAAQARHR